MIRIATAAILIALSMGAAQAGTATVRHGDLNLANPQDVQTLKVRVQQAAETACGAAILPTFGVSARTLYEAQAEQKTCVKQTAARALGQIQARNPVSTRLARQ
jgi:UrcA family protein